MWSQDPEIIAERLFEAFNAGQIDAPDNLIAPNCIDHTANPGQEGGLAGLKLAWAQIHFSFLGPRLGLEDVVVDADRITLQALFEKSRPGSKFRAAMMLEQFRVSKGKIVELWNILRWSNDTEPSQASRNGERTSLDATSTPSSYRLDFSGGAED